MSAAKLTPEQRMQRRISRLQQQVRDLKASRDHGLKLTGELTAALRRALDAGIGADGRLPSASEQARAAIAKFIGVAS